MKTIINHNGCILKTQNINNCGMIDDVLKEIKELQRWKVIAGIK